MTKLRLRIDFEGDRALGPGKIRLLELVGETGSISAAGRAMEMSYRRARLLVSAMNRTFRQPTPWPGATSSGPQHGLKQCDQGADRHQPRQQTCRSRKAPPAVAPRPRTMGPRTMPGAFDLL